MTVPYSVLLFCEAHRCKSNNRRFVLLQSSAVVADISQFGGAVMLRDELFSKPMNESGPERLQSNLTFDGAFEKRGLSREKFVVEVEKQSQKRSKLADLQLTMCK